MGVLEAIFGEQAVGEFRRWRWLRNARRQPSVSPADAAPGVALLMGFARPIETLVRAPFTQSECTFWMARLEAKVWVDTNTGGFGGDTNSVMRWREEFRVASTTPFEIVDDAGGVVRVESDSLVYVDPLDVVTEDPHVNDDNPILGAFLRANGVLPTAFMGIAGDHRFYEKCIATGDVIGIYGRIGTTTSVRAEGYRDAPDTALRMSGTQDEPLFVFRF